MNQDLLIKLASGRAILFAGAGFSASARNMNGDKNLPLSKDLAKEISKIGNFQETTDLRMASEYFFENICKKDESKKDILVDYLYKVFTIQESNYSYDTILTVPWKRIYTTNYDDLIEVSAKKNSINLRAVDIDDSTELHTNKNLCVHINGYIHKLDRENINTRFKISESSYLNSNSFEHSNWHYIFKNDFETCSAIIFAGYSLYDMEIKKILFENPKLKDKIYFIQRQQESDEMEDFMFQRYGHLLKIGIDGFSKLISENSTYFQESSQEAFFPLAFEKYELSENMITTIGEKEIESFLRYGDLSKASMEYGMTTMNPEPFLIIREKLNSLLQLIKENKIIVITSELGNGKSIFLREASLQLTIQGYDVLRMIDSSADYITDIDNLVKSGKQVIIIVDSYSNYYDLFEYFLKINAPGIKLVLAERTSTHHMLLQKIQKNINIKELNIDILTDIEVKSLIDILDFSAFWGEHRLTSTSQKEKYIKEKCKKQLSLVLLDILNSRQIKEKISILLNDKLQDTDIKKSIFLICMLDVMDISISLSLIDELSSQSFAMQSFTNADELRQLVFVNLFDHEISTKSSIYSLHLLNEHFDPQYVIGECLNILEKLDNEFKQNYTLDETRNSIRKNIFRFNFIESIISKNKTGNLVAYYERMKSRIPSIIREPQYWLQYGMANIAFNKYEYAEKYLNEAYTQAMHREKYDTVKIDNQKARLNIKKASQGSIDQNEAFRLFFEADELLAKSSNDVFKFKIVLEYAKFFSSYEENFPNKYKPQFKNACQNRYNELMSIKNFDIYSFKQQYVFRMVDELLLRLTKSL